MSLNFILASGSPRRSFLLKACGFEFIVAPTHVPEDYHPELPAELVPRYLAQVKAEASRKLNPDVTLILTADTVVILDGQIMNKPSDGTEAVLMLEKLSGKTHEVITAVGLSTRTELNFVECRSAVRFKKLAKTEILEYVRNFKPMDKAGAYGAQECLPEQYDPCSNAEREFLIRIAKPNLLGESKPSFSGPPPMVAIDHIEGSYFNVMGLPIHELRQPIIEILGKD